jgi:hypothetical protein
MMSDITPIRERSSDDPERLLSVACPWCDAEPDEPCKSASGTVFWHSFHWMRHVNAP